MMQGCIWSGLQLQDASWYVAELGDLSLYLMRKGDEYITATRYQQPLMSARSRKAELLEALPEDIDVKERLYLSDAEEPVLALQLADKPYQVKPATLVKIAPKSRLVLYVSTPLWLQLMLPESGEVIVEYPTVVPRMSWVGPSTTEGSLCYSTQTSAPSNFAEVKQYKHRALTALEVVNDGETLLAIDRLSLPLNILSLYHSEKNGYWTESVRYRINADTGETKVVAAQRPPEELGLAQLISRARNSNKTGRFRTAMNMIVG